MTRTVATIAALRGVVQRQAVEGRLPGRGYGANVRLTKAFCGAMQQVC